MKDNLKAIESTLLANLNGSFLLMAAMADVCIEQGRDEEASGWRYMADNKRFPDHGKYGLGWIVSTLDKDDARKLPTFGQKRESHPLNVMSNGCIDNLALFLQASACIIGGLLTAMPNLPKKARRRTYADMSDEEVNARQTLAMARTDLRYAIYDEEPREINRLYSVYATSYRALRRITHPDGPAAKIPTLEQLRERYNNEAEEYGDE